MCTCNKHTPSLHTQPPCMYVHVYHHTTNRKTTLLCAQDAQEQTRFDDEEEVRRQVAARRAKEQQERLQQAYDELVHTDKAADMREQQLLRAEMALAYRTGDHAKAERLALRLAPDEVCRMMCVWNDARVWTVVSCSAL